MGSNAPMQFFSSKGMRMVVGEQMKEGAMTSNGSSTARWIKRALAALAIACLCVLTLQCPRALADTGSSEGGEEETAVVTRGDWLRSLVELFDMTVDEDNYPDNYFTDLSADSEYYRDILVAVEFGLVDVEAGGEIRADDPVTREFAAHTLNQGLGFQLDEGAEYTFSDVDALVYPDDAQVAVNRGWVDLIDGAFMPSQPFTSAEAEFALADAKEVWASTKLDGNHKNVVEYADGVKVIGTDVKYEIADDGIVYVYDTDVDIKAGDTFAFFTSLGLPGAYTALDVSIEDGTTVIKTQEVAAEDAFEDIDYEFTIDDSATTASLYSSRISMNNVSLKDITISKTLSDDGLKLSIDAGLTDLKLSGKVSSSENMYYVKLNGTEYVHAASESTFSTKLPMGTCGVENVAWVDAYVRASLKGSEDIRLSGTFCVGVQYSGAGGWRTIHEFHKNAFTLEVESEVELAIGTSCGFNIPSIMSGSAFAEIGSKTSANTKIYDSGSPRSCVTLQSHLFFKMSAKIQLLKFEPYSATANVWTASNSPIRLSVHIEDSKRVAKCSRGGSSSGGSSSGTTGGGTGFGSGWYSPVDSPYITSPNALSSGTGTDGSPVVLWEYTVGSSGEATITKYNGKASYLRIPDTIDGYPVTAIGDGAFQNNEYLTTLIIPDTIDSIGNSAFAGCTSLATLTLPDADFTIGQYAFNGCTSLSSLEVPSGVASMGFGAFRGCTSLSELSVPGSVYHKRTNYSDWGYDHLLSDVFPDCTSLRKVTVTGGAVARYAFADYKQGLLTVVLGEGVSSVGDSAFLRNTALKAVVWPSTLASVPSGCFEACTSLTSITLPEGIESLGDSSFSGCASLTLVNLPSTLSQLGSSVFNGCTRLVSISVPEQVKTIGDSAFAGCVLLSRITLHEGLEEIGKQSFSGCVRLVSVSLPGSLHTIDSSSFENCIALQAISFPDSVTSIGDSAFSGCTSLKSVGLPNSSFSVGRYAFNGCTSLISLEVPSSVALLGTCAFNGCTSLSELYVPGSVLHGRISYSQPWYDRLLSNVFPGCTSLRKVTVTGGAVAVEAFADYSQGSLTVVLDEAVSSVGDSAFLRNTTLKTVVWPSTLTAIPSGCFSGCTSMLSASLPEGVEVLGDSSFQGCTALASVGLPSSLLELRSSAFNGCTSLSSICIPNSVYSIGDSAFSGCIRLTSIELPEYLSSIESSAFSGCISLKQIALPDCVDSIGSSAFNGCTALQSIAFPDSVTGIGDSAFSGCTSLRAIDLPDSSFSAGRSAFSGCTSLSSLRISPGAVLGTYAFQGCTSLSELYVPGSVLHGRISYSQPWYDRLLSNVFPGCTSLRKVTVTGGAVADRAFADYSQGSLTVVLEEGVSSVGDSAFSGNTALRSITLPSTVAELPNNCFNGCSMLSSVKMSDSVTKLGTSAFKGCKRLTAFELPTSVAEIGDSAFSECTLLKSVSVLNPEVSFGNGVFDSVSKAFVLSGYTDSTAQAYAASNNLKFKALDIVDISTASIASIPDQVWTGQEIKPSIEVTLDGTALVEGEDFTVEYVDNVGPGTATVTIAGVGKFEGAQTVEFKIVKPSELPVYDKTPEGYVRMLYGELLGNSSPTDFQVSWWVQRFAASDAGSVMAEFADTPTFTGMGYTARESARLLYAAILGNASPTEFQVSWWADVVSSQGAVAAASQMCDSDAFRAVCAEYGLKVGSTEPNPDPDVPSGEYARTPRGYAEMLYNKLVGVESPTEFQLTWWEGELSKDAASAVASFASSNAFGSMGYTPEEAAKVLYAAILGNDSPSDFQVSWWAGRVTELGPEGAAAEMTDSDAFHAVCAEYGMGTKSDPIEPDPTPDPDEPKEYDKTPRGYAEMLYNELVNNDSPTDFQLSWWEGELSKDAAAAVASFASSNAFGSMGYTSEQAAKVLYAAILGNSDPSDFQVSWWAGRVAEVGPEAAAAEMTDSDAFRSICSEYGLSLTSAGAQEASDTDLAEVVAGELDQDAAEDGFVEDAKVDGDLSSGSDSDASDSDETDNDSTDGTGLDSNDAQESAQGPDADDDSFGPDVDEGAAVAPDGADVSADAANTQLSERELAHTPYGYAELTFSRLLGDDDPSEEALSLWAARLSEDAVLSVVDFVAGDTFQNLGYDDAGAARTLCSTFFDLENPSDALVSQWADRVSELGVEAATKELLATDEFKAVCEKYGLTLAPEPAPSEAPAVGVEESDQVTDDASTPEASVALDEAAPESDWSDNVANDVARAAGDEDPEFADEGGSDDIEAVADESIAEPESEHAVESVTDSLNLDGASE